MPTEIGQGASWPHVPMQVPEDLPQDLGPDEQVDCPVCQRPVTLSPLRELHRPLGDGPPCCSLDCRIQVEGWVDQVRRDQGPTDEDDQDDQDEGGQRVRPMDQGPRPPAPVSGAGA